MGYSRLELKMQDIDIDYYGNFGPLTQNFRKFGLSSRIWVRIIKFALNLLTNEQNIESGSV